jgi:hypothetical protein
MLIPCSRSGLANLRHACPVWHAEWLAWRASPILFLFLLPSQSLYIVNNVYVCVCVCIYIYIHTHTFTHISDCVENVVEILLLPYNTASETILHKLGGVQSVDWIYHQATGLAVTWRIRDFGQNVSQPSFQTGSSSNPSYFHNFFLIAFLKEACITKIIIIVWINYSVIIIICINNNEVINNNYERLWDLILLFKVSMGTQRNFFKIYRPFWHAPFKGFTGPALGSMFSTYPSNSTTLKCNDNCESVLAPLLGFVDKQMCIHFQMC